MSGNPIFPIPCPKGQYTKIATNITSITIHKMKTDAVYLWTYRLTGEADPTLRNEAVRMFVQDLEMEIKTFQCHIDLYVWCDNEEGILRTSDGPTAPVPSIVTGSNVVTNRTVELVKLGHMFLVQKVFTGLTVASTKDFLIDLSSVTASFLVLYEFSFSVTQGKAIGTFFEKGDYSGGSAVPIQKKNENKAQTPNLVLTEDPTGTTPGPEGTSYLAGGEAQGVNLAGGERIDKDTPTETNISIDRLLRFVHSGGTGFFDLELRVLFAEIP